MAKVLIKELEPYRPLFIEEPVLAEQAEYYPKLAAQTHIPLAAGLPAQKRRLPSGDPAQNVPPAD